MRVFLVLAAGFCTAASIVATVHDQARGDQDRTAARGRAATVWLASRAEAARVARVEREGPPVAITGEAPLTMTLQQWMKTFKVPGLSVAVFDRHEIVWAKSYGVTQSGGANPVTIETLFQAASISKPITALAALHFVEAGQWTLDENINDKLVSWKAPDNEFTTTEKVTLRRLLSHTAGTTVHGFPGYAVGAPIPTLVQVLDGQKPANTTPVRVDLVPGSRERYSGGGTTIVQLMMVDQLKKPFPQIMSETVLQPLGLRHSSYEQPLPPARAAMTATGTYGDGRSVAGRWHVYPEMAAAGLWTTPSDLARIAIEVSKASAGASTRVLSTAMTKQMLTEQMPGVGLGFGLGPGKSQYRHNGANEGFQSYLTAFADTGSGVVIMANSDNGSMIFEPIVASVAKEYRWASFTMRHPSPFATITLLAQTRGVDRALAWYKSAKATGPERAFGPGLLNGVGYGLLRSGRTRDALKVFAANVEVYPGDANAWDSLGEAQMTAGDQAAAIVSYRKSLELDPANTNAVRMLDKLGARPPVK